MAIPAINNIQSHDETDTTSPNSLASYVVSSGGSNKVLIACIFFEDNTISISGVDHGGDALTAAIQARDTFQIAEIWYRVGPTAQTANLNVTFTGAALGRTHIVAFYLTDAHQTSIPDVTGKDEALPDTAGTDSILVTTTVDDCLVVSAWNHGLGTEGGNWAAVSGTDRYNSSAQSQNILVQTQSAATAGSQSSQASTSGTQTRPVVAVAAFRPVAAVAATPKNPFGLALSGPLERVVL